MNISLVKFSNVFSIHCAFNGRQLGRFLTVFLLFLCECSIVSFGFNYHISYSKLGDMLHLSFHIRPLQIWRYVSLPTPFTMKKRFS